MKAYLVAILEPSTFSVLGYDISRDAAIAAFHRQQSLLGVL